MDAKTIAILNSVTHTVYMPKLSDISNVVKIKRWGKNVGDYIKRGDLIAELETDVSILDLESYSTGVLLYKAVENDGVLEVGEVLAIIGKY